MSPIKRLAAVTDRVTSEHVLLLSMLSVAVYMLVESTSYSPAAAFFPRFTAAITIAGGLLLLFSAYLPTRVRRYVTTSVSIIDQNARTESVKSKVEGDEDHVDGEPDDGFESKEMRWGSNPGFVTVCLMGAYILGSYLFGMIWVTPLFVFAYLVVFRARLLYAVVLSALSYGLALLFMRILQIDIASGVLFGGLA